MLYERDPSYRDSDFYSLMYPSLELLEQIGRGEEPAPDGIGEADEARRRGLPFLLVEYAHAMGNGPGSLQDYWRDHDRARPALRCASCGSGSTMASRRRTAEGVPFVMHGDDVEYEPRGGRFSLHGLVFSDRTPTPGLVELAKAYAPVSIDRVGAEVEHREQRVTLPTRPTSPSGGRWRLDEAAARSRAALDGGNPRPRTRESGCRAAAIADRERLGARRRAHGGGGARRRCAPGPRPGHVVAWGQGVAAAACRCAANRAVGGNAVRPGTPHRCSAARRVTGRRTPRVAARATVGAGSRLRYRTGSGRFDAGTDRLVRLGALELDGPCSTCTAHPPRTTTVRAT